jgi:predicted MFS family arabinose efflux permease
VPLILAAPPAVMAVLMAVSGLALPPVLTVVFLLADRLAPAGTAAEAFAWIATAFAVGSATGAALAGPLAAHGLHYGFAFAPVAAAAAVVVMLPARRP